MALSGAQTIQFEEDFAERLQQRLNEPNVWKEVCEVQYSDRKNLHWPYLADETISTTGTRSSPYTYQALSETDESLEINREAISARFLHEADRAQKGYVEMMDIADRMARQIDESIETTLWQQYSGWDVFDGVDIGGAAGSITVSLTNIDDIIRNVTKLIYTAKGGELLAQHGGFFVWKPGDFEKLQAFYQANGFNTADEVLRNGVRFGFTREGYTHYVSNRIPAGFAFAGVKKQIKVGVLKSTYGNLMVDSKDPGSLRGTGLRLAADWGVKTFNFAKSILFQVAVA